MNQQNDTRQHDKQQEVYQVSTMTLFVGSRIVMEISPFLQIPEYLVIRHWYIQSIRWRADRL
ncbi:hypothetical protein ACEQPO_27000 [Bacillus sp. SL00103]